MIRKIMRTVLLTLFTGWVVAASPALAAGEFYGGWSVGQSRFVDFCDDVSGLGLGFLDCDETDMGWKVFGGYQATSHLGFELDYVDLGAAELESVGVDLRGFGLAAIGSVPFSDVFAVFAKVGMWRWDVDVDSFSDDGVDLRFGVGAKAKLHNRVGLRAEWERFGVDEEDADLWSLGLTFAFN